MEFYEYEAGLAPAGAGYTPTAGQAAVLALGQAGVAAGMPPGIPFSPESVQAAQEAQLQAGDEVQLAGTGLGAGLGLGIVSFLASMAAGALLPVGPGGEVSGSSPVLAPSAAGPGQALAAPGTDLAVGHEAWVNGVPTGGPGVPEPPKYMIAKAWNVKVDSKQYGTFRMQYFRLIDGRCMSYHSPTRTWKIWKPKKHIVISSNPRVKMLSKLNQLNKRVTKMLKPYQPRPPKTKIVPGRALSAIERAELKV